MRTCTPICPIPKTPHAAMLWQSGSTSLAGIYIHIYIYIYTHTHRHIHMYIYTYMCTCAPVCPMPNTPQAAMLWQSGSTSLAGRHGSLCDPQSLLYEACRSASVQRPPEGAAAPAAAAAWARRKRRTIAHSCRQKGRWGGYIYIYIYIYVCIYIHMCVYRRRRRRRLGRGGSEGPSHRAGHETGNMWWVSS